MSAGKEFQTDGAATEKARRASSTSQFEPIYLLSYDDIADTIYTIFTTVF